MFQMYIYIHINIYIYTYIYIRRTCIAGRQSDEPLSPKEGACLRYILNRKRQIRGVFKIYVEPEPPVANEGPCCMSQSEIAK